LQVLAAVRSAVGDDKVVALRLSCDELAPWAGITPEVAAELAAGFAAEGGAGRHSPGEADRGDSARIDLLTVVRGSIYSAGATRPDGHTPPGFNLELTREVRAAVRAVAGDRVPVVAQGSIVDAAQAEWAVGGTGGTGGGSTGGGGGGEGADGAAADAVEMTRAQIADPLLVGKLAGGHAEQVRPCVLCNQMCAVRDNRNPIVTCVAEPFSGHETTDTMVRGTALRPVDVLVVGGGPAGLEAARVAALRGHRVRVAERGEDLGGRARTVARLPGRERFALLADWLEAECRRLGVDLRVGHEVTAAEAAEAPHMIVATGGRDGVPTFERTKAATVLTAASVLDDPAGLPAGAVLVWDPIGGPTGVGVAEVLAADGREVHLATPDWIVGNELARAGDLGPANARLSQAGVVFHKRCRLTNVRKGAAVLADRFSDGTVELKVDAVVDAGHRLPDDELYHLVREGLGHRPLHAGDSVAPRTVFEAILEGRRRALELG